MKINRGIGVALGILLLIGIFASWRTRDFSDAQAANDRQAVDCLTSQLTHEEKQRIAQLTAAHDSDSLRSVYAGVFPRCIVRSDQWERKDLLILSARQVLNGDPEFRHMLALVPLAARQN